MNFRFGGKEEFMTFMNDFVEQEWANMKDFLARISVSYCHPANLCSDAILNCVCVHVCVCVKSLKIIIF